MLCAPTAFCFGARLQHPRVLPVKTGRSTLDILNGSLAFAWNGAHLIVTPSPARSSWPRESGFLNSR